MNFRRAQKPDAPGFQMAPMIDVVFLLLVFFMVASIFAQWESKVDIKVPVAESFVSIHRKLSEIMVNVDQEGRIYVNAVEMSRGLLLRTLKNIQQSNPGTPIIIRADGRTDHAHVMAVLDVCRLAHVTNVSFATLETNESATEPATP